MLKKSTDDDDARQADDELKRVREYWREALPSDRMSHLVNDVSRAFRRTLRVRLAEHDVKFGHWLLLRILWINDGLTQRELALQAGVMAPTTLVALRAMKKLGYVELRRLPENRKNVYTFLTPEGQRLRELLMPIAEEINDLALAGFTEKQVASLRQRLMQMLDNLTR